MTSDSSYRTKGRAVFLAALMVLSVVAMSASFAGAAAAAYDEGDEDYDVGPTYDLTDGDETSDLNPVWIGQEVTLADDNLENYAGYEIREGSEPGDSESGDVVEDGSIDGDKFTFDTDELDTRFHHINLVGAPSEEAEQSDWDDTVFRAESEELDVSFDESSILEEERADITIESERKDHWVNVTEVEQGLEAEDFEELFQDVELQDGTPVGDITVDPGHDDDDVVTIDVSGVDDELELSLDTTDLDAGDYEFEFDVTDSLAADNASVEVRDDDADRYFNDDAEGERGSLVNISVSLEDTDDANIVIGDGDDVGYEAGLSLAADSDDYEDGDEIVLEMNSHTAGDADADQEEAFRVHDDYDDYVDELTLEYFNISDTQYVNADGHYDGELDFDDFDSGLSSPLAAGDYELEIGFGEGDGWDVSTVNGDDVFNGIDDGDDAAFLALSDRGTPGEMTLHTAPADFDLDEFEDVEEALEENKLTETDSVAHGDSIVANVPDFGAEGLVDYLDLDDGDSMADDEALGQVLNQEGINITFEEAGGVNVDGETWTTDYDQAEDDEDYNYLEVQALSLDPDDYDGDVFLKFIWDETQLDDTEVDTDLFEAFDADSEFDVTFELTEDNSYITDEDDEIEQVEQFDLVEPELSWDAGVDEVPAEDGATVTGTSNVAPGTEVETRAAAPGTFRMSGTDADGDDVLVEEDGTFSALFDFGEYDEGTEFELTASNGDYGDVAGQDYDDDMEDEVDSVLVKGDEEPPEAGIEWDVDVDPAAPEEGDDVDVTVSAENVGEETENASYEFYFAGDTLLDGDVELEGDESDSWTATVEDAEAGDYDWELKVDGDVESDGVLSVSEEMVDDDDGVDDDGVDDDEPVDDEAEDDGTPGFGAAVAAVALLAAAMLALRRQN